MHAHGKQDELLRGYSDHIKENRDEGEQAATPAKSTSLPWGNPLYWRPH